MLDLTNRQNANPAFCISKQFFYLQSAAQIANHHLSSYKGHELKTATKVRVEATLRTRKFLHDHPTQKLKRLASKTVTRHYGQSPPQPSRPKQSSN